MTDTPDTCLLYTSNKANIVFNISGGNNQILPNAITAEQNFYEVCGQAQKSANWKYKEAEEMLKYWQGRRCSFYMDIDWLGWQYLYMAWFQGVERSAS